MRWMDEPMPTRRFPFSVDKPDGGEIRVTVSQVHCNGQSRARLDHSTPRQGGQPDLFPGYEGSTVAEEAAMGTVARRGYPIAPRRTGSIRTFA